MRKSAKKQQSQVQTIHRTVTSRNVTQDNRSFHVKWSRQCNPPSQILMKFDRLIELFLLIKKN